MGTNHEPRGTTRGVFAQAFWAIPSCNAHEGVKLRQEVLRPSVRREEVRRLKMGSEADGGRAERAVQEGAGAGAMVLGAPGGPGEPREPGAPSEPGGRGAEGEAGAASGGGSQVEQAPHGPGPDGDAAPAAGRPGRRRLQLYPVHGAPAGWAARGGAAGGVMGDTGGVARGAGGRWGHLEAVG